MAKGVGQPRALSCPQVAARLACGGCWMEREERGKGWGQAAGGKQVQGTLRNALASCGRQDGVSRTRWLQTTRMYCLAVREATSLKLTQRALLLAVAESLGVPRPVAVVTPTSASVIVSHPSCVSVSLLFLQRHQSYRLGLTLIT